MEVVTVGWILRPEIQPSSLNLQQSWMVGHQSGDPVDRVLKALNEETEKPGISLPHPDPLEEHSQLQAVLFHLG